MAEIESVMLLKPGTSIKPLITSEECKELLEKLYGLKCTKIRELIGYDDKNFKVNVCPREVNNAYMDCTSDAGYVLKIMNSLDSKKIDFVDGQNSLLLFLDNHEISCPKPVQNINGQYYSLEKLKSGEHIIRLMVFLPGKVLHEISCDNQLFHEVGRNIAIIDHLLKDFQHSAYNTHKTVWMLDAVPQLRDFIYVIKDPSRKLLLETIINDFESEVLSKRHLLECGIIHGDCNEQNIIVDSIDNHNWHFKSILDFGDTTYSCYVFELAITTIYMILLNGDLAVGGHVLAGYNTVRKVTDFELSILKLCMSARLCQSLVLGAYSSVQDPENSSYLLTTATKGWDLLTKLWNEPNDVLIKTWKQIISDYS